MNKKFLLILVVLFFTAGCAKLAHLDQLLILKGMDDEQKQQRRYVEAQDKRFEKIRDAVQNGQIQKFSNQKQIAAKFGQPVYRETTQKDNQDLDLWVYRYTVKYFDSDKVYLYFDKEGKLVDSVYEQPPVEAPQESTVNSPHL